MRSLGMSTATCSYLMESSFALAGVNERKQGFSLVTRSVAMKRFSLVYNGNPDPANLAGMFCPVARRASLYLLLDPRQAKGINPAVN
jgi:hypothetical protein